MSFVSSTLLVLVVLEKMIYLKTVLGRLICPQTVEESLHRCHRKILLVSERELYICLDIETEDTTVVELHAWKTYPMPWRTSQASGVLCSHRSRTEVKHSRCRDEARSDDEDQD